MNAEEGVIRSKARCRQLPEGSLAACTWTGEKAAYPPALSLSKQGLPHAWQEAVSKELLHGQSHRIWVKRNPRGGGKWVWLDWLSDLIDHSTPWEQAFTRRGRQAQIAATGRSSLKTTVKTTSWCFFWIRKKIINSAEAILYYICVKTLQGY